jgi:hypothetical protein
MLPMPLDDSCIATQTRPPAWLQIAESEWDSIKASVLAICASSSRSSKPAIYGVAAEAEVRRLRPLSSMGQLEVLAA